MNTLRHVDIGKKAVVLVAVLLAPIVATRAKAVRAQSAPAATAATPAPASPATTVPAAPAPSSGEPAIPQPLPGQLSSKYPIDRTNPEASVPGTKERDSDPLEYGYLIQDLLTEAELAKKKHDYQAVVLYYRAVAKAVPDNAKGWSKLCEAYEIVNDRERAIRACKYALERPAVELQDYIRYVRLHVGKPGELTPAELTAVGEVLVHLDKQPSIDVTAAQLKCEVGVKAKDLALLEACTQKLTKLAPDDPKTIVFQWNLAVQKGQQGEALLLVERAKKAGVVMANVERMKTVTESSRRIWPRLLIVSAVILAGIAALLMWQLRRRRLAPHRLAP